jgi:hypothetical protein
MLERFEQHLLDLGIVEAVSRFDLDHLLDAGRRFAGGDVQ